MRNLHLLDAYRIEGQPGDERHGAFIVPSCSGRGKLAVEAKSADGWDHVSVSRDDRWPDWAEMEQIALLVLKDDETAMVLHTPARDHVKGSAFILSWWRPHGGGIPDPHSPLIGCQDAADRRLDRISVTRE